VCICCFSWFRGFTGHVSSRYLVSAPHTSEIRQAPSADSQGSGRGEALSPLAAGDRLMREDRAMIAVRHIWLLISTTMLSAGGQTCWAASPFCAVHRIVSWSFGIYLPGPPGSLAWSAYHALHADGQLAQRWVPQPRTRDGWHTHMCRSSMGQ